MLLGTETTGLEAEGAWPVPRSFSTTGVSILPAKECGGKARQRPGSSGSQLSPALSHPSLYPPPPSLAERKANERGKVSSSPPLLSRQLCRKKPQLQAQMLNRTWKAEAAGRGCSRQTGRAPHQPSGSSSFPQEAASPPPQHPGRQPPTPME